MEWLLANPQIHSMFASLGSMQDDNYVVSEDCLTSLDEINCKLMVEDHTLRTFRRAIGFGQNIRNDLIPLMINTKDISIIDKVIRLLVNLTVPIECLLSVEVMSRTEIGRHTIFELNKLLLNCKEDFVEPKSTKAIVDYMKAILEKDSKLSVQQCDSINNCLLLFRNILHIPESTHTHNSNTPIQNHIIWNLFTQSIDKLLIHLMSCPQRAYWSVTMAQLIALMYKDQHINTLQKLLNLWFDATLSDSSEDNESNTSPPKQCSGDSSPMLTSDPTSDSSDNGSGKMSTTGAVKPTSSSEDTQIQSSQRTCSDYPTQVVRVRSIQTMKHQIYHPTFKPEIAQASQITCTNNNEPHKSKPTITSNLEENDEKQNNATVTGTDANNNNTSSQKKHSDSPTSGKIAAQNSLSENSDCGYGTQVEKESISTSSNEDDSPQQKPVHQKPPPNQKQRFNAANKQRNPTTIQDKKELRRKKLVKRSKSNIINMKGLPHHIPTDEDISNILKEFTVDFLLKGYGFLVHELHAQLLTDLQVQIDTSHFFWLVTYFLKFASQLELDLEHINTVLSFDIVSYLTFEGVTLCEQLEQLAKQSESDMRPCLRRIHLVVTAIREFLQALETYNKSTHLSQEDKDHIKLLQLQIGSTEDLRCLFVLLLRCYNPNLQSRQYLQDLVVTNHILLLLLDGVIKPCDRTKMMTHISQFANVEIMYQYGLLLEDFRVNGEFVNDCIFTMMHHIGGDLGEVNVLFQPIILKTYSQIWETEYEICDDWSDLIEYVIHKFMNTPKHSPLSFASPITLPEIDRKILSENVLTTWSQEEQDLLFWYYTQCKKSKNLIDDILKLYRENGNTEKSRIVVIQQLLQQDIISLVKYDDLMKMENPEFDNNVETPAASVCTSESGIECKQSNGTQSSKILDDIQVLRDRLMKENKSKLLLWLQKALLDCCFVKLNILKGIRNSINLSPNHIMEPVPHHSIIKKQSIPIVPWNSEQNAILCYQPFILLLHKLGFHLPADANKLFVRIPEFWTADILYSIANKLGPIDESLLKFDVSNLGETVSSAPISSKPSTSIATAQQYRNQETRETMTPTRFNKSNSIIRFTPDSSSNWMLMVMKNKGIENESEQSSMSDIIPLNKLDLENNSLNDSTSTSSSRMQITTTTASTTLPTSMQDLSVIDETNDEEFIEHDIDIDEPINHNNDDENIQIVIDNNCDDDFDDSDYVPKLEEHEVVSACETASVASYLTQMYVSDEEDKHYAMST
uniref:Putative dna topoisomerase i-interacting protein n=1 Tax=Corethrella appendiculata TaxID=1370023 RepID=U5EZ31_9DIPT